MLGGDTLILLDGTYSDAAGTGYISYTSTYGGDMPSGSSTSAMTTVKAQNEGNVTISSGTGGTGNYAMFLGRSATKLSYAKVQGITFIGGGTLYNTNHVYIKNCGFYAARQDGGDIFGIGTNDGEWGNTYNLIEDVWVWGKDRLISSNYYSGDHNIWRRVVVRGDGCSTAACNGSGNPNVGITVYNSQYVSLQNVIVLDRVLSGSGNGYGSFATAQHSPGESLGPVEWLGCMALNGPDVGFYFEADASNGSNVLTMTNCITWNMPDDGFNIQSNSFPGSSIQNCTSGATTGSGFRVVNMSSGTLRNLTAYNNSLYGYNSNIQPSYTDVYGAGTNYNQTTPTNAITTNPGILYLPRIEVGSPINGTGYGGADRGANVIAKYGVDGTFWGEAGYNTLQTCTTQGQSGCLWPYPNEARIKSDFASVTGGTRGFATGTSRDGTPQTLTKYIWEYLGNTIPADIYNAAPDITPPTITAFIMPATATSKTVQINSFMANDAGGVTGYLVTENPSKPSAGVAGWSSTVPESFMFSTSGNMTAYAWAKDSAGNVSESLNAPVTIYLTLQDYYNSVPGDSSIFLSDGILAGSFSANRNITALIKGECNQTSISNSGFTVVNGKVVVQSGKVIFDKIIIR